MMSPPPSGTPEPEASPPRRSKGDRTRGAILAAAAKLFDERGYVRVGVDEIAREAGVAPATLYSHFRSRQHILLAVLLEGFDHFDRLLAPTRKAATPLERIGRTADAYLQFVRERPAVLRFLLVRIMDPDDDPALKDVNDAIAARTRALAMTVATDLREAKTDGRLPEIPLDELVILLWSLGGGLTTLMVRQDGAAIPRELADRVLGRTVETLQRAWRDELANPDPPDASAWGSFAAAHRPIRYDGDAPD